MYLLYLLGKILAHGHQGPGPRSGTAAADRGLQLGRQHGDRGDGPDPGRWSAQRPGANAAGAFGRYHRQGYRPHRGGLPAEGAA